jgi:hypothetical protein
MKNLISICAFLISCQCLIAAEPEYKVTLERQNDRVNILVDNTCFTSYLFGCKSYDIIDNDRHKQNHGFLAKPVLYPVKSPDGTILNRGFPLKKVEDEKSDHPHHVGLYFTYDIEHDRFWANTTDKPPHIKHAEITQIKQQGSTAKLTVVSDWIDSDNKKILREDRTMVFHAAENENYIDFKITLTSTDRKITFADSKEGLFAFRLANWLNETDGKGQYLSSQGLKTEKEVWATRSEWARIEAENNSKTYGVAIINHPASTNFPSFWMTRGYGLFSANPLGQGVYTKARNQKDTTPLNLTLEKGQTADFLFRLVIYQGPKKPNHFDDHFVDFAKKYTSYWN